MRVVAARDQQLPELPSGVEITWDEEPDRGPLQGIHAGLRALRETAEAAYITSCDVPLLVPAFVETLIKSLELQFATSKVLYHHRTWVPNLASKLHRRQVLQA